VGSTILEIPRIKVKGLGPISEVDVELRPLTVFIGPNNSGKSSLIQAIQLLCQVSPDKNTFIPEVKRVDKKPPYVYPTDTYKIDIGRFEDVIRKGSEYICIKLGGENILSEPVEGISLDISTIKVEFEVKIKNNQLSTHNGYLEVLDEGNWKDIELKWKYPPARIIEIIPPSYTAEKDDYRVKFVIEECFELIKLLNMSKEEKDLELLRNIIGNAPRNLLESCHFIYPLRGFEEAGYVMPEKAPKYSTLENITLNDRVVALIGTFAYNANLRKEVARELSSIMDCNIDLDFQLTGSTRGEILLKEPINTLIVNEGIGFQQVVFILIPLILIPDNSTVFIQEPEAHLHPAAQVKLGKLLIKFLKKKNLQLFIETHSEHILHAFIHAIAKKDMSNNELAVYYFENEKGRAKVINIEVDELGRVKGGFPGFFDQSLNELKEFLEAVRGREK